jgi:hypothetical protein
MLASTPAQAVALQASQRSEPAAVSRALLAQASLASSLLTAARAWPAPRPPVSTEPVLLVSLAQMQQVSMVTLVLPALRALMPQASRAPASQAWPASLLARAARLLVARVCPSSLTAAQQSAVPARMPVNSKPSSVAATAVPSSHTPRR